MDGGLLCLKWRDHRSTFFRMLSSVRKKELYCDATVACDGQFYPVHKLVLSTCSEYFEQMFEVADKQHLMIVLADIQHRDLETLLDFMYVGEVNVLQSDLSGFMRAAERLKIKGLAEPTEAKPCRKESAEGRRCPPQREDHWEAKRRRQDDGTPDRPPSEAATSGSPDGPAEPSARKESCDESSRLKTADHTRTNCSSSAEILSPAQLASAELASGAKIGSAPGLAPALQGGSSSCAGGLTDCDDSQVKLEDVNVKEEPEDWSQAESMGDSHLFKFSDPALTCLTKTAIPVAAASSWDLSRLAQAQSMPLNALASSLPGPSGLHSRKIGRPTSGIWNHYTTERNDGKTVVHCKYCTQKYGYPNATKMKAHILKCDVCPEDVRRQFRDVKQEAEHSESHSSKEIWKAITQEEQEEARSAAHKAAPEEQTQVAAQSGTDAPDMLDVDVFLTAKEEMFVIDWLEMSDDLGFSHLKDDLLNIVQKIFVEKQRKTPFPNGLPSNSWYSRFLKRHPSITSRIHKENLILKSLSTFDALKLWYSNLEMFLTKISSQDILSDASRIYSAGTLIFPTNAEAGVVFDPRSVNDRTPRVLSQFVSVFEAVSASGRVSPGTVVLPDEAIPGFASEALSRGRLGWRMGASPSGTIQSENLLDYLETVFIPWLRREDVKTPVILFLHGHCRTLITPELCKLCKDKVVIVHSLHPYTVQHKQVPVMMALLDPLLLAWGEVAQEWKTETKSPFLSYYGFFMVLSRVLKKVAESHKIQQAFQLSGLYPFKLRLPHL